MIKAPICGALAVSFTISARSSCSFLFSMERANTTISCYPCSSTQSVCLPIGTQVSGLSADWAQILPLASNPNGRMTPILPRTSSVCCRKSYATKIGSRPKKPLTISYSDERDPTHPTCRSLDAREESILACIPVCKSWHNELNDELTQTISKRRLSRYQKIGSDYCEGTYSYVFPVLDRETQITYVMKRLKEGASHSWSYWEADCLEYLRGGKAHYPNRSRFF